MPRDKLIAGELTESIIGAFYEVYNALGYGFLEHIYILALEHELRARGHRVAREVGVRIMYKGFELAMQRLDMIVDDTVVVETKSTEELHKSAARQLRNYLAASTYEVGLLLHFGLEAQFRRIISTNSRERPLSSASPSTDR
jgi:GxxExxY protein